MPLPRTIRVKVSSEDVGAVSLTPVVLRDLAVRELIEYALALAGKDESRIREILRRGSLVSGGSRLRWPGWDCGPEELREVLASFPDPDLSRRFSARQCRRVVLRGGREPMELPREAAVRTRVRQGQSFWDLLMEAAGATALAYGGYCYRERADWYIRKFTAEEAARLREESARISDRGLREKLRSQAFSEAELYVPRENPEGAREPAAQRASGEKR